ncbi:hypothetical protein NHF46_20340 [Arthrobacter alpinus]|nr:hypothetical protein [Arthrobacter alpinus]
MGLNSIAGNEFGGGAEVNIAGLPIAAGTATVSATPGSLEAGQNASMLLAGFPANSAVTLTLDAAVSLGSVTTDAAGAASKSVTIPAGTTVGNHTVTATSGEVTATAALVVTAPVPVLSAAIKGSVPIRVATWPLLHTSPETSCRTTSLSRAPLPSRSRSTPPRVNLPASTSMHHPTAGMAFLAQGRATPAPRQSAWSRQPMSSTASSSPSQNGPLKQQVPRPSITRLTAAKLTSWSASLRWPCRLVPASSRTRTAMALPVLVTW